MPGSSASLQETSMRWQPCGDKCDGPVIVVAQGDLTACAADAIVNPANSQLAHGGGVAGAIASKGGRVIDIQSREWIRTHKQLPVGHAMSTRAGKLPCRFVVHTVGPRIGGYGMTLPTPAQAQQLRDAVWNALCEAERLQLASVAMPGISSGIFGYPRDLAAKEILGECVRYARERASTTTLKEIALMNIDKATCKSFVQALRVEMELSAKHEMPEEAEDMAEGIKDMEAPPVSSEEEKQVAPHDEKEEEEEEEEEDDETKTIPEAKTVELLANFALAASIVAKHVSLEKSLRVIQWNALSSVVGKLGALSLELIYQQRPQEIVAILEMLQGYRQRRVPFYMKFTP